MIGYSGTPLAKKLGYKPEHKVYLHQAPENYLSLLGDLPENLTFLQSLNERADLIHLFSKQAAEMEKCLFQFKEKIVPNGCIWVSWYKKAAKIPTDITEDVIRETALALGLVDIKVCAVDEKWSGLKLVIRRENRYK
ncbi:MAG: hypothetical protein R2747_14800 [Pyrinomonadaceae bacterium]